MLKENRPGGEGDRLMTGTDRRSKEEGRQTEAKALRLCIYLLQAGLRGGGPFNFPATQPCGRKATSQTQGAGSEHAGLLIVCVLRREH